MIRSSRYLAVAALAAALLPITNSHREAFAAKPAPPPPPPPPVQYWLKTFDMPPDYLPGSVFNVHQMTESGVVVGEYQTMDLTRHGFIYDPSRDADMAFNLTYELGVVGLEEGERIAFATDINNLGFVVGGLEHVNFPGVQRGYLLDLNTNPPSLTKLPDLPNEPFNRTYARRINDSMDILGVTSFPDYEWRGYLYNPLVDEETHDLGFPLWNNQVELSNPPAGSPSQVVGQLINRVDFRYTNGVGLETFSTLTLESFPTDISPNGEFCGAYAVAKRRGYEYYAFRYGNSVETFSALPLAEAINGDGDFGVAGKMVYVEGTGAFSLSNAVTGSVEDLAYWSAGLFASTDMTERGALNPAAPGFGGMCGRIDIAGSNSYIYRACVLIPMAP